MKPLQTDAELLLCFRPGIRDMLNQRIVQITLQQHRVLHLMIWGNIKVCIWRRPAGRLHRQTTDAFFRAYFNHRHRP